MPFRIATLLAICWFGFMDCSPFSPSVCGGESREFTFRYGATLRELPPGKTVRVWIPMPRSDEFQRVVEVSRDVPLDAEIHVEPQHGNRILYFTSQPPRSGEITFHVTYRVARAEANVLGEESNNSGGGVNERDGKREVTLTEEERKLYTSSNRLIPLSGKPLTLLDSIAFAGDRLTVARQLYDRVDEHVRYDKSRPGYGNGDVLWVCDSRFGNCTDFHSLFISFARARNIPARFEIGFPLPAQRGEGIIGGYHCWAWFHDSERGWVPVDISEADKNPSLRDYYFGNLTANRIAFSGGRDVRLVPTPAADPVNYFIYPHVEVDGEVWPREKTEMDIRYADIGPTDGKSDRP